MRPLRLLTAFASTSPKGRGKSTAGSFLIMPNTLATRLRPWLSPWERLRGRTANSLSQNLTVLPAPSGREPLARPQTLHFSRKLYRYAKGPIPEEDFPRPGEDVTEGDKKGNLASRSDDWGSFIIICTTSPPPFSAIRAVLTPIRAEFLLFLPSLWYIYGNKTPV